MGKKRGLFAILVFAFSLLASGCGYGWRGKDNPWAAKGIHKIYIRVVDNNTLRAGVEIPFTSALVKEFERGGKFKVVSDESDADAFVISTVGSFGSTIGPMTSVASLTMDPEAQGLSDMLVASEYVAQANITVSLVDKEKKVLWVQQFGRPKVYPAGNRFGLPGTTSALINASQEQMALQEIVLFIASDVYDTMVEAF